MFRGKDERVRVFAPIWVLWLFEQVWPKLIVLNRQLTRPPKRGEPFKLDLTFPKRRGDSAFRFFQQALQKHTDPDFSPYEEHEGGGHFLLFPRVACHVPYSEDRLFRELHEYLASEIPPVGYAFELIERQVDRLGLHRMSPGAIEYGLARLPRQMQECEDRLLAGLASNPDPIHLVLLIALFHERQWLNPNSQQANRLDDACVTAVENFQGRPEFARVKLAKITREDIASVFHEILLRIRRFGHRSTPPLNASGAQLSEVPRLSVLVEKSERLLEADACAEFGARHHILNPFSLPRWRFYTNKLCPARSEAFAALNDLIQAADLSPERLRQYRRVPEFDLGSGIEVQPLDLEIQNETDRPAPAKQPKKKAQKTA